MLRRFRPALLAGAFLLALGVGGCGRPTPNEAPVQVELAVEPQPPAQGPAKVTVTLADGEGAPVTGAEVKLEGNMSHPGMVPVFADARELEPGRYQADLEFTMGGDWYIIVTAKLPDQRRIERQFPVPGVRPR